MSNFDVNAVLDSAEESTVAALSNLPEVVRPYAQDYSRAYFSILRTNARLGSQVYEAWTSSLTNVQR